MKIKKFFTWQFILICLFYSMTVGAQPAPYKLTNPVLIRPFGDSITYGIGFTDDWQCLMYTISQNICMPPGFKGGGYRGWMTLLSLNGDGIIFTTEGYQSGGSYFQQWLVNTQTHDGYPGWTVEDLTPIAGRVSFSNITLVHAGTNDMWPILKIQNPTDAQIEQLANTTGQNLFNMLNVLLTSNPKTYIFVAQIIKVAPPFAGYETVNKVISKYNSYIANNWPNLPPSSQARMTLVDMHNTLQPGADYFTDGIHPSANGHLKIACSWIRAIKAQPANQQNPCDGITTGKAVKQLTPSEEETKQMTPPKETLERILKRKF
ncbi:GDSL-type esterase/lipase family protein [Leptospira andrefontaineae]|uniref:Hydrolase n=1 Tax=Leptospira andrefontaineae TaxID=2484976 RepID=A0A4R9H7F8_9LEPT|nr:GDSL-type esterase/lipase family protein [Leptospira andrefontaineae]TGK41405.1 hydrolase [Leptospira andrefontaineae]